MFAGIEPGRLRDASMRASVPPCATTAAMKTGFMPPSVPVRTGPVGVPRLISVAISTSSRFCFSLTAVAISAGTS